jgi:hypothetical protein
MKVATNAVMPRVWVEDPTTRPRATIRSVADLRDTKLTLPLPLRGTLPKVIIDVAPGRLPDYFECGPLRLVSRKLMTILAAECRDGEPIEFIPVDVFQGQAKHDYWFGHVLDLVECLDLEKSRYTTADGIVDAIDHLEIVAERTLGHKVFRVAGTYEYLVCVDAALSELIATASSGSTFVEPSAWRW